MGAKSLWDQIEKMATRVLCSDYYLDDNKTICQDYTKKYDKIDFFDIYRGTSIGCLSTNVYIVPKLYLGRRRKMATTFFCDQ